MTGQLKIVAPCPDCMRPLHKGKTCVEAALDADYNGPKPAPLCPICNRYHPKKEKCQLRSREEEELYRQRKW
jgi:hypothetical protein